MPLETATYDLGDELEAVKADAEEAGQAAGEIAPDAQDDRTIEAQLQTRINEGQRLQRFATGLEWAVDTYGEAEVTLGAPTNGERHLAADLESEIGDFTGVEQLAFIAVNTVDAPWCEHDPDTKNTDAMLDTVANVRDMHPAFADWVDAELSDMGVAGDAGNAFERSFRDALQSANG